MIHDVGTQEGVWRQTNASFGRKRLSIKTNNADLNREAAPVSGGGFNKVTPILIVGLNVN